MRHKYKLFAVALISLTGVFVYAAKSVIAQDALTLSVSPPLFELSANPGDSLTNSIRLTNLSDESKTIFVDKRNFTALGEEGGVDLTEDDTGYSLASWVDIDRETATVGANQSEVFNFTINVPSNAEPGGHFGSIVFRTETGSLEDGQAGAAVGQEIGSLLLVRIAGDVEESIEVISFESERGFYEKGPVVLANRVKNTGNVHIRPQGSIVITNMFGREVANLQLNGLNVLPDSIRRMDTDWDDSSLRFGRYKVSLNMVYGSDNEMLNVSTSFFMVPYKHILVVTLILLAAVFIVRRYKDRFKAAFRVLSGK